MANLRTAKKSIRKSKTRTIVNLTQKRDMKKTIKEIRDLVTTGETKKATKLISIASKKIDKAAKNHLIHKNTASRLKSRIAKRINKAESK